MRSILSEISNLKAKKVASHQDLNTSRNLDKVIIKLEKLSTKAAEYKLRVDYVS